MSKPDPRGTVAERLDRCRRVNIIKRLVKFSEDEEEGFEECRDK